MPYCRRCGTKLDEDARFCHKCGTAVSVYDYAPQAPSAPMKPLSKDPVIIGAIVLISILVVGVVVAALLATPFSHVNIEQTFLDDTINVKQLNLDFESDNTQVNVFTQNSNSSNFVVSISGSASKSIFGGEAGSPLKVTLNNDTINGVQTVKAKLEESTAFSRYNVVCNIYVNPALTLNLNITSQAGQVNLTSDKPTTFEFISLKTSAGTVGANLQNVTVAGNMTLGTQAGTVHFRASQVIVKGNRTVDLHSNSGTVNMDITQTKAFQGNLQVNAVAGFGSVNVGLTVDGDVGAKIVSQTNLGSIHTDLKHFSGNQSPIQTDNYPAPSNIEIDSRTHFGDININAAYQSTINPSLRN